MHLPVVAQERFKHCLLRYHTQQILAKTRPVSCSAEQGYITVNKFKIAFVITGLLFCHVQCCLLY